ncbi:MAG: hypothetical protein M0R80_31215 [Proteobacteria bacterium]|nr:hypothetical protein [Pseudomonadota bacterium]
MDTRIRSGNEPFTVEGRALPFCLGDFWRWSASDLLSNALRGILAEFIVLNALGLDSDHPRAEWDAVDLRTPDGIAVEVKSAAYLQSWTQKKLSKITFNISPAKVPWDARTNTSDAPAGRQADLYVFCLFAEKDRKVADPLDLAQWRFFVLPARVLDAKVGGQKTVSLGRLESLGAAYCHYSELKAAAKKASSTTASSPAPRRPPA